MGAGLRKINRRIAKNIVNHMGVPKQGLSLRKRLMLLTALIQQKRQKMAEAATKPTTKFEIPEELTPEAIQARKEADEPSKSEVSASENQ